MRIRHICKWMAVATLVAVIIYWLQLDNPGDLKASIPKETALMRIRKEEAKQQHKSYVIKQKIVALSVISPLLKEAVRLSEDASFYSHDGFDFNEIEQTLKDSLERGYVTRGASTISQQLIKNLYLSPSRNPLRKIAEAYLTIRLEQQVSKDRILEIYLNSIEWGPGIFGVEAASQHYFKHNALALEVKEAVLLAAMLPMPLKVNPLHPNQWLKKRALRLLKALNERKHLTLIEYHAAMSALN